MRKSRDNGYNLLVFVVSNHVILCVCVCLATAKTSCDEQLILPFLSFIYNEMCPSPSLTTLSTSQHSNANDSLLSPQSDIASTITPNTTMVTAITTTSPQQQNSMIEEVM